MKPFFTYFGGKWRTAKKYGSPTRDTIIEPFAGSAGYSVRHNASKVFLYDLDEKIVGVWSYLIAAKPAEILRLPLFDGSWGSIKDLSIPQEAKWLIGFWLNKGAAQPCCSPSLWMRSGIRPNSYWGEAIRGRLAQQVDDIKHWKVFLSSYQDIPNSVGSWFIDPPYIDAGRSYRKSSKDIDFSHLAEWCKSRLGEVIVCENAGADWLPFVPFIEAKANRGKNGCRISSEVIWRNNPADGLDTEHGL